MDARLLAGGVLFGTGWGLAGVCPGPALVRLAASPVRRGGIGAAASAHSRTRHVACVHHAAPHMHARAGRASSLTALRARALPPCAQDPHTALFLAAMLGGMALEAGRLPA